MLPATRQLVRSLDWRGPADTEALAADAESCGWTDEAAPHHRVIEPLDHLMAQAQAS
jgi:hypothetical protein